MGGTKMLLVLMMMLALMSAKLCRIDAQNTKELPGTRICNGDYVLNKATDIAVNRAINDVVKHTSDPGYHRKRKAVVDLPIGDVKAWAIGACYGKLTKSQCNKCMVAARDKLRGYCTRDHLLTSHAKGAQIKLQDCRLRWELYNFDW